jgi:N,N'-diacetyllegionaminate synthase
MIELSLNKKIAKNGPCFIIAEAGVNHNGSLSLAKKLVDIAVEAKADAVKFQTFIADEIILKKAPKARYHIETTGSDRKQSWHQLLKSQEMSKNMHKKIIEYCRLKKIIFMSTPYDYKSCDLLYDLGVEIFKIASTDTNNFKFIEYVSKKKKPVILSTAMANSEEVDASYKILKKYLKNQFVIMQCTGSYPAPIEDANLNVIKSYKEKFKCLIGYSDHVVDNYAALAATAIGISCYEKHITVNKKLPGPDHRASMEKKEFIKLVKDIRKVEMTLGSYKKKLSKSELQNVKKLRKYLVAGTNIFKGEKLNNYNMNFKRTGGRGISASNYYKIKGKKVKRNFMKDQIIKL